MLFVTVINRPLQLLVFLVMDVKQPLRIMTLFMMVLFKDRYGLKPSNSLVKCPLSLWLISNGRCGGVVGLGPARIIGSTRCFMTITNVLLCNGLQAPVTNVVLPIWDFHVVSVSARLALERVRDQGVATLWVDSRVHHNCFSMCQPIRVLETHQQVFAPPA